MVEGFFIFLRCPELLLHKIRGKSVLALYTHSTAESSALQQESVEDKQMMLEYRKLAFSGKACSCNIMSALYHYHSVQGIGCNEGQAWVQAGQQP
jgi:hypothetical protein